MTSDVSAESRSWVTVSFMLVRWLGVSEYLGAVTPHSKRCVIIAERAGGLNDKAAGLVLSGFQGVAIALPSKLARLPAAVQSLAEIGQNLIEPAAAFGDQPQLRPMPVGASGHDRG